MDFKIEELILDKLLEDIETYPISKDGCACGEYVFKLKDNLFLSVYRSCRKSGSTPGNNLWHIHNIEFYENALVLIEKYNEIEYLSYIELDKEISINLNENQKSQITNKFKKVTEETWGVKER
jgi:hypothetical protein